MSLSLPDPWIGGPMADEIPGLHPVLRERLDGIQRNFERLAALGTDTGGQSLRIRHGSGGATWTASTTSAAVTVSHGLGMVPVSVSATFDTIGSGQHAWAEIGNRTLTTFDLVGVSPGAFSGTLGFYWFALG